MIILKLEFFFSIKFEKHGKLLNKKNYDNIFSCCSLYGLNFLVIVSSVQSLKEYRLIVELPGNVYYYKQVTVLS